MRFISAMILLAATLAMIACSSASPEEAGPAVNAGSAAQPRPEPWKNELLAIAAEYTTYQKMAQDPAYAPTMCRMPYFSSAFISKAEGTEAHGRKLYFLWVKDVKAYPTRRRNGEMQGATTQPVGQVLVKEAFAPGEGANPDDPKAPRTLGEKHGLFVMFKTDPATEGTDTGWVYGTVSADGKHVTSAGRIDSCMGCHENAKHDRLFGLPEKGGAASASKD